MGIRSTYSLSRNSRSSSRVSQWISRPILNTLIRSGRCNRLSDVGRLCQRHSNIWLLCQRFSKVWLLILPLSSVWLLNQPLSSVRLSSHRLFKERQQSQPLSSALLLFQLLTYVRRLIQRLPKVLLNLPRSSVSFSLELRAKVRTYTCGVEVWVDEACSDAGARGGVVAEEG